MTKPPGYLIARYVNGILNQIDFLKESVENCDPKAIEHSTKIIMLSKEAAEKGIIKQSDYDKWMSLVGDINRKFTNKCSCIKKR